MGQRTSFLVSILSVHAIPVPAAVRVVYHVSSPDNLVLEGRKRLWEEDDNVVRVWNDHKIQQVVDSSAYIDIKQLSSYLPT